MNTHIYLIASASSSSTLSPEEFSLDEGRVRNVLNDVEALGWECPLFSSESPDERDFERVMGPTLVEVGGWECLLFSSESPDERDFERVMGPALELASMVMAARLLWKIINL